MMRSIAALLSPVFAAAALALALPAAVSADDTDAHALYQENCTKCHSSEIYTRPDRRIQSLDALNAQVRMCEQNLELKWFDDQVDSVVSLLNEKYYKFEQ
jgi:cytochrome c553